VTSFAWGAATDVGRVRHINQDSLVARFGLYAVADGMGGHTAGEVAAEIAVEVFETHGAIVSTQDLIQAVHAMNAAIMERADAEPELSGMGTTLCALALVVNGEQERLALANVGDSRIYVYAGDELQQLTEDHSLVAQLVRDGTLTESQADRHPQRNVLTRALGIDPDVAVDAWEVLPFAGDRFVLCSDGLSNELTDDQIAAVLRRLADPQEAANELVRLANENGGRDNITVVVVDIIGGERTDSGASSVTKQRVPDMAGFETAMDVQPVDDQPVDDQPVEATTIWAGVAEPASHASQEVREPRPPIFTVRMVLFLFACVLVLLIALGAVFWIGRRTYYVAFNEADQVVIYRGRPGGVLWLDPTEAEVARDLNRSQIPVALVPTLDKGHDVSSLGAGRRYIDNVRAEITRASGSGATATTVPPTTGTAPPTTAPVTTPTLAAATSR
jgi:protein phosphatase